jgi:hypothetical protein
MNIGERERDGCQGFILLHRKICKHWLWQQKPFNKIQAWVDILLECNYTMKKVNIGNKLFICGPGESLHSVSTWAIRWGWGKSKVKRFFKLLETDSMIERIPNHKTTHVKVCNYEKYRKGRSANEPQKNRKRTTNNKGNKGNNIYSSEVTDIVDSFHSYLLSSDYCEYKNVKNWNRDQQCDIIEKLNRLDNISFESIRKALEFVKQDDFWSKQVQSLNTLRNKGKNGNTKFENILSAMKQKYPKEINELTRNIVE